MMARLPSLLLLIGLLAGWEAWCRLGGLSPLVLPAPSNVLATLWSEIATGRLWPHLTMTAAEMARADRLATETLRRRYQQLA